MAVYAQLYVSNCECELGNSDFLDQLDGTIIHVSEEQL